MSVSIDLMMNGTDRRRVSLGEWVKAAADSAGSMPGVTLATADVTKVQGQNVGRVEYTQRHSIAGTVTCRVTATPTNDGVMAWRMTVEATERWSHRLPSPFVVLGMAIPSVVDGAGIPLTNEVCSLLGRADSASVRSLVALIEDPDRSCGLMLLHRTPTQRLHVNDIARRLALHAGLVKVFVLDDTHRDLFEEHSGDKWEREWALRPETGLYLGSANNPTAKLIPIASLYEDKKAEAFFEETMERRDSAVSSTTLSADQVGQILQGIFGPSPEDDAEMMRTVDELEARAKKAESLLDGAIRRAEEAERQKNDLRAHVGRLTAQGEQAARRATAMEEELAAYRTAAEALATIEGELDSRDKKISELEADLATWMELATACETDRDEALGKLGAVSAQLYALQTIPVAEDPIAALVDTSSFDALLDGAAKVFEHLDLDFCRRVDFRTLDSCPEAPGWRRKLLAGLATLDAYAAAVLDHKATGVAKTPPMLISALSYVKMSGPGARIVPTQITLNESATVRADSRMSAERIFEVSNEVDSSGKVLMLANLKFGGIFHPAPRCYFHDDVRGATGKIVIGYVGPHLTTKATN